MRNLILVISLVLVLTLTATANTHAKIDAQKNVSTILEKTFLGVDVLELRLQFSSEDWARLGQNPSDDLIEKTFAHSKQARIQMTYLRSFDVDRLLNGIAENLIHAKNSNYITAEQNNLLRHDLPQWFSFLNDRGIKKGDQLLYVILNDTLNITYKSFDGKILLQQTDQGAFRRRSILGSYFAKGSEFREGLLQSVHVILK